MTLAKKSMQKKCEICIKIMILCSLVVIYHLDQIKTWDIQGKFAWLKKIGSGTSKVTLSKSVHPVPSVPKNTLAAVDAKTEPVQASNILPSNDAKNTVSTPGTQPIITQTSDAKNTVSTPETQPIITQNTGESTITDQTSGTARILPDTSVLLAHSNAMEDKTIGTSNPKQVLSQGESDTKEVSSQSQTYDTPSPHIAQSTEKTSIKPLSLKPPKTRADSKKSNPPTRRATRNQKQTETKQIAPNPKQAEITRGSETRQVHDISFTSSPSQTTLHITSLTPPQMSPTSGIEIMVISRTEDTYKVTINIKNPSQKSYSGIIVKLILPQEIEFKERGIFRNTSSLETYQTPPLDILPNQDKNIDCILHSIRLGAHKIQAEVYFSPESKPDILYGTSPF